MDNELQNINYESERDRFVVRKYGWYYCSFKSLDEAIKARNWLVKHDWDKELYKKEMMK